MKTIDESLGLVLQYATCKPPVCMPVSDALGLVLAEDVSSDIDSPPFDKSLVDGYAVVASSAGPGAELTVIEQVAAGALPTRPVGPGVATRIMTGAPLPAGADAVVMVEHTRPVEDGTEPPDRIRISAATLQPGTNIMRRGACLQCQQRVLAKGHPIRGIEIGLLCEVGRTRVAVTPPPSVAVLATGDELVPADTFPQPGRIRNSNGPMLAGLVRQAGANPALLGVARDERPHLRQLVRQGLEHDCLLLSGGVSAGMLDLVPSVLSELGVQQVFHRVRLRPGKPLWFGVLPGKGRQTLVFGLPGNPVSSLVCFWLFVRPALMRMMGRTGAVTATRPVRLASPLRHQADRPTYHPAHCCDGPQGPEARLLAWQGSADQCALAAANCLVRLPQGDRAYRAGDSVDVLDI